MSSRIDVIEDTRRFDQPATRFGAEHQPRDFGSPLTYDLEGLFQREDAKIERLTQAERPALVSRGGKIAVMDSVSIANRKPVARLETLES